MVDKLNPTPDSDSENTVIPHDHYRFLDSLKAQGRAAQVQARRGVDTQLISLYWPIGHEIHTRQNQGGWAAEPLAGWARVEALVDPALCA